MILAGCQAVRPTPTHAPVQAATSSPTQEKITATPDSLSATITPRAAVPKTEEVTPSVTPPPISTATLPPESPAPQNQVCSPLQDVPLSSLEGIITNPFVPSPAGQEGFHTGIDLSFYHFGTRDSIFGLPVLSALAGQIVAVNPDRPPYGNMVIVETPLEFLPKGFLQSITTPLLATPSPPDPRLTCPALTPDPGWIAGKTSLYILYAHLNKPPLVNKGKQVACGQPLGEVGNSGNDPAYTASGNPHLHFELRLGPSGAVFEPMSHHNNKATPEEIYSYCMWRVSGYFVTVDPLKLVNSEGQ
jgi:murein DD-endopeptidase MepM/ murein hydrolase activator NlpD